MALSADGLDRQIENPDAGFEQTLDVAASVTIYEGGACFRNASGHAVPTTSTGTFPFLGMAVDQVDNSSGSITTDKPLRVRYGHIEEVTITGVTVANIADLVYATDDNTFTLSPTNAYIVGRVYDVAGTNRARVEFLRINKAWL